MSPADRLANALVAAQLGNPGNRLRVADGRLYAERGLPLEGVTPAEMRAQVAGRGGCGPDDWRELAGAMEDRPSVAP